MDSAIDGVAFLANSTNRVEILETIAAAPRTRHDLRERTASSRVTLGRVLRELETRNWITRDGHEYRTTPLGDWVCVKFGELLAVFETERELRDVLPLLPMDEVAFDLERLQRAEIVRATRTDPTAPIRRAAELLADGTHIRMLTTQVVHPLFEIVAEAVLRNEKTIVGVATPDVCDTILTDDELAAGFRHLSEANNAVFYVTDDVPVILHIVDDDVLIELTDDEGNPRAGIRSDDEVVYQWAVEEFETVLDAAERVTPDTLTA